MTTETVTANSDLSALRDEIERLSIQLSAFRTETDAHLVEVHRIVVALAPLVEHMPRLMALLDPFAKVRGRRGKDAVPFRASAPVPVGEASQDRPPMGA